MEEGREGGMHQLKNSITHRERVQADRCCTTHFNVPLGKKEKAVAYTLIPVFVPFFSTPETITARCVHLLPNAKKKSDNMYRSRRFYQERGHASPPCYQDPSLATTLPTTRSGIFHRIACACSAECQSPSSLFYNVLFLFRIFF
jgi:hypothetical protein